MTDQTNAELLTKAYDVLSRPIRADHESEEARGVIQRLAAALEAAEQRADEAEREMHARELHHFEEEERAAGLAAVVENALILARGPWPYVRRNAARDTAIRVGALVKLLERTPADILREHDARVWDEGFDAGERDAMEHETFDEPCIENPYRDKEQDQ